MTEMVSFVGTKVPGASDHLSQWRLVVHNGEAVIEGLYFDIAFPTSFPET